MPKQKLRPILTALLILEFVYVSFWSIGFVVLKLGWWPSNLLHLNGYNIMSEMTAVQVVGLYTFFTLLGLALHLFLVQNKTAITSYILSVFAHALLWISLIDNSYFHSEIGFLIIIFEVIIVFLMLSYFGVKLGVEKNTPKS